MGLPGPLRFLFHDESDEKAGSSSRRPLANRRPKRHPRLSRQSRALSKAELDIRNVADGPSFFTKRSRDQKARILGCPLKRLLRASFPPAPRWRGELAARRS